MNLYLKLISVALVAYEASLTRTSHAVMIRIVDLLSITKMVFKMINTYLNEQKKKDIYIGVSREMNRMNMGVR